MKLFGADNRPKEGTGPRRESLKSGLFYSMSLGLWSRILAVIQTAVTAAYLGVGMNTDIYFYVFTGVTLFAGFLREVSVAAIIPRVCQALQAGDGDKAAREFNAFFLPALAVSVLAAIGMTAAPTWCWRLLSSFPPAAIGQSHGVVVLSGLLLIGTVYSNLIMDYLGAFRLFRAPLIVISVCASAPLLFLVARGGEQGAVPLMQGSVVNAIVSSIALGVMATRHCSWTPWKMRWKYSSSLLRDLGLAQVGNLATLACGYLVLFIFSAYGPGAVSALGYARMLANIPRSLIMSHISAFVGLKFNYLMAENDWRGVRDVLRSAVAFLGVTFWPACWLVWILRNELSDLFFHFKPPPADAKRLVADLMAIQVLTIPLIAMDAFVSRLLVATKRLREGVIIQVSFYLLMIVGLCAGRSQFGPVFYGYLNFALYVALVFLAFPKLLSSWFSEFNYREILWLFARFGLLSGLAAMLAIAGLRYVPATEFTRIACGLGLFVVGWILPGLFLKDSDMLKEVRKLLTRRTVLRAS